MSLLFALACLPLLPHAINTTLPAPLITAETCGFQGDDSIYGLGVRLGLYLQWFATCLADNFLPDEAIAMRGVNVCASYFPFYISFPAKRHLDSCLQASNSLLSSHSSTSRLHDPHSSYTPSRSGSSSPSALAASPRRLILHHSPPTKKYKNPHYIECYLNYTPHSPITAPPQSG